MYLCEFPSVFSFIKTNFIGIFLKFLALNLILKKIMLLSGLFLVFEGNCSLVNSETADQSMNFNKSDFEFVGSFVSSLNQLPQGHLLLDLLSNLLCFFCIQ